jgi:hypothetical protein
MKTIRRNLARPSNVCEIAGEEGIAMPHEARDPDETRPLDDRAPTLFPEHNLIVAIWIAAVVIAIAAVVR